MAGHTQDQWFNSLVTISLHPTLVFYEFLITFDREVALVWQQRFSLASSFVIWIRWNLLLGSILISLSPSHPESHSCLLRLRLVTVPVIIGYIQTAAFCGLRTYALGERALLWAIATFLLGLVPAVTEIYILVTAQLPRGFAGFEHVICGPVVTGDARINAIYTLVSRLPVILAELIAVVVTWRKTYRQYEMRASVSSRLSVCLFRDGNAYFISLMFLNIMQLLVHFEPSLSSIVIYLDTLPPIYITRFLFDIRRVALRNVEHGGSLIDEFAAGVSDVVFAGPEEDDLTTSDIHSRVRVGSPASVDAVVVAPVDFQDPELYRIKYLTVHTAEDGM